MATRYFSLSLGLTLSMAAWQAPAFSALPDCQFETSDPDGDGFGWENQASCRVRQMAMATVRPVCTGNDSDPDNDGFGWENRATCLTTTSTTPEERTCLLDNSDSDGDGFGWENNKSCIVANQSSATPSQDNTAFTHPRCESAISDPDGDGFGWENDATCLIDEDSHNNNQPNTENTDSANIFALSPEGLVDNSTPEFTWTAIPNVDEYRIVVKDAAGNGYRRSVDALTAGCQTGGGNCNFSPTAAYFDNDLQWYVESAVGGQSGPRSNTVSITTPFSANIQPIKSNTTACEAWPSVAYDEFVVLNNSWNSRAMNSNNWSQTIFVDQDIHGKNTPTWSYDWLGQFDGGEIDVKAYPEVIYGSKLGTHVSGTKAQTGLPEIVRDLPEFTIEYDYTETGSAERNVALESFFHDSCNIAGPCDDIDNRVYEMMVWVNNPTIRTPGQLALTGIMIDNKLWDVYIKPDSNKHYIAFTAQNPQTSGTLNWNRFVDWTENWTAANAETLKINVLSPDFCMGAIELGTEMWWGSGSFTLNEYKISH